MENNKNVTSCGNYELISVRTTISYPEIFLEGKIEILPESDGENRKYVYLIIDIRDVGTVSAMTDFWCYHYPYIEMYDSAKFTYNIEGDAALEIMHMMVRDWKLER